MILNFGSINLDLVYRVPHLPAPGETLASLSMDRYLGGKGINQSIAAARAGATVRHVGCVGPDGDWLCARIEGMGVRTGGIARVEVPSGHALILVDAAGENQIVIVPGANHAFTEAQVAAALDGAAPGDWVLLQNETNLVAHIARAARERGLRVAYSAAPFATDAVAEVLEHVTLLALNLGEAAALERATGRRARQLGPARVLVTRGAEGATLWMEGTRYDQPGLPVRAVDTTGAGDTFLGAFLARLSGGSPDPAALRYAAAAAALQVTRQGAAEAGPDHAEVEAFLARAAG